MKIRQLRPELFYSETLSGVSAESRWLFLGLMCASDDHGYLEFSPDDIKGSIYSTVKHEAIDLDDLLKELHNNTLITIFKRFDKSYIKINHWDHFQKIYPKKVAIFTGGMPFSFPPEKAAREQSHLSSELPCQAGGDLPDSARPFPTTHLQVFKTMELYCDENKFPYDSRKLRRLAKDFWHYFSGRQWTHATKEKVTDWSVVAKAWVCNQIEAGKI